MLNFDQVLELRRLLCVRAIKAICEDFQYLTTCAGADGKRICDSITKGQTVRDGVKPTAAIVLLEEMSSGLFDAIDRVLQRLPADVLQSMFAAVEEAQSNPFTALAEKMFPDLAADSESERLVVSFLSDRAEASRRLPVAQEARARRTRKTA